MVSNELYFVVNVVSNDVNVVKQCHIVSDGAKQRNVVSNHAVWCKMLSNSVVLCKMMFCDA